VKLRFVAVAADDDQRKQQIDDSSETIGPFATSALSDTALSYFDVTILSRRGLACRGELL